LYEFSRQADVVVTHVVVESFRPEPDTVCEVSNAHLAIVHSALESTVRESETGGEDATGGEVARNPVTELGHVRLPNEHPRVW
jgi:hypothetical protein